MTRLTETSTVKFNIGGQKYEVAKEYLDLHPHTMLANISSEQWRRNVEEETIIDHNGALFKYVMDYLRGGLVFLPFTLSREIFMEELAYYGFVDVEENKIRINWSDRSTDTVRFNVSGQKYQVFKVHIDLNPKTELARMVSEEWHEGKENEIFIKRNGSVFQYVLDYLRDGKVYLPFTVPKHFFINELTFYGFEDICEERINFEPTKALVIY